MRLLSWIAPGRSKFKLTLFNVYFASHHVRSGGLGTRSPSMKGTFESGDNREEKKKKTQAQSNYGGRWSLWAARGSRASRGVGDGQGMRGSSLKSKLMKSAKGS